MAHTACQGGGRIEEAQGKTGQAQGDQGWTRKEIGSTKEGKYIFKYCQIAMSMRLKFQMSMGLKFLWDSNFFGTQIPINVFGAQMLNDSSVFGAQNSRNSDFCWAQTGSAQMYWGSNFLPLIPLKSLLI